jgi:hypothetical protein
MDKYDPNRDISDTFISKVAEWIEESGEVFVALRYLRAAGSKDYALCYSKDDFLQVIQKVGIGTDIIAIQEKQLPLRGIASNALMDAAMANIPDGSEYLIVRTNRKNQDDPRLWGLMGDSHQELQETLKDEDCWGLEVALGILPPFMDADNDKMISASKGGIDGPR